MFDDIPPSDVRRDLKSNGWRWSPKNQAWQRKNTENAKYNASYIIKKHYDVKFDIKEEKIKTPEEKALETIKRGIKEIKEEETTKKKKKRDEEKRTKTDLGTLGNPKHPAMKEYAEKIKRYEDLSVKERLIENEMTKTNPNTKKFRELKERLKRAKERTKDAEKDYFKAGKIVEQLNK